MNREEILKTAEDFVKKTRDQEYGDPRVNFNLVARFWTLYIFEQHRKTDFKEPYFLTTQDVAAMMILLKVARIATGSAKADNWIDIAGYAACGGEVEATENNATN